jgi:hypothetical protein
MGSVFVKWAVILVCVIWIEHQEGRATRAREAVDTMVDFCRISECVNSFLFFCDPAFLVFDPAMGCS